MTAQRVEENLQKADLAITALDGQALIDAGASFQVVIGIVSA